MPSPVVRHNAAVREDDREPQLRHTSTTGRNVVRQPPRALPPLQREFHRNLAPTISSSKALEPPPTVPAAAAEANSKDHRRRSTSPRKAEANASGSSSVGHSNGHASVPLIRNDDASNPQLRSGVGALGGGSQPRTLGPLRRPVISDRKKAYVHHPCSFLNDTMFKSQVNSRAFRAMVRWHQLHDAEDLLTEEEKKKRSEEAALALAKKRRRRDRTGEMGVESTRGKGSLSPEKQPAVSSGRRETKGRALSPSEPPATVSPTSSSPRHKRKTKNQEEGESENVGKTEGAKSGSSVTPKEHTTKDTGSSVSAPPRKSQKSVVVRGKPTGAKKKERKESDRAADAANSMRSNMTAIAQQLHVVQLLHTVAETPSTTVLDLSHCTLWTRTMVLLCNTIAAHPALSVINLCGTKLAWQGLPNLVASLLKCKSISQVDTKDSNVGPQWAERIAEAVNKAVEWRMLHQHAMSEEAIRRQRRALLRKMKLIEIEEEEERNETIAIHNTTLRRMDDDHRAGLLVLQRVQRAQQRKTERIARREALIDAEEKTRQRIRLQWLRFWASSIYDALESDWRHRLEWEYIQSRRKLMEAESEDFSEVRKIGVLRLKK